MNNKVIQLLFFLCTSVGVLNAYSQNNIKGTVKSSNDDPVAGATVKVKGTQTGAITDAKGTFQLKADTNATLVFSFIGYTTKEVPVNGRSQIEVILQNNVSSLNNVVVIGYGTQKSSDLSSSIASVNPKQLKKIAVLPNAAAALEGTTPGVNVTQSGGAPGAGINIKVRGTNTFGNNNPLVIIDGSPGDLNNVNPEDIATMQVLKDAAAAAIYGSRAANGVVIVTTKNGQSGKVNIDLKTSYGFQSPEKFLNVANSEQYATIDNALHKSAGLPIFDALSDPSSLGKGTDWQHEIYHNAPILSTYMGIYGGNDHSTYRISGSFDNQKGIAKATWYRKGLFHFNGQQEAGPFTFGESMSWTDINQRTIPGGGDKDLTQQIILAQPIIPVYDSANDGGYGGAPPYLATQAFNPLGLLMLQDNTVHDNDFNATVYGQLHFLKYFTYKLNVGYRVFNGYTSNYTPTYYMSAQRQNIRASLGENRYRTRHWLVENTLNYKEDFGDHHFNALIGYSAEEDHERNTSGFVAGFPNNDLRVISATTGYSISAGGNEYQWDLVSLFGRLIYSYNDKYYLTANIRRDGSSRFGPVNRHGIYPSASLAWRISNESFFQGLKSTFNNVKIRGSYGSLGNQPGADYAYIPSITYDTYLGYLYEGGFETGAAIEAFANPEVQWETSKDFDLGIDITLLNNIGLSADYYLDKTDNLLLGVPIPPSTGTSSPPVVNTGKFRNQGVDVSLSYHSPQEGKNFNYSITGNFSTIKNKVVKLGYAGEVIYGAVPHRASTSPVTVAKVGYPVGAFFTKQADGLFQSQKDINNYKNSNGELLQPNAQPGDVRYIDVNGDGMINNSDVAYSGTPFPTFTYGLNFSADYKNFDFTLFIQGTQGNKMFDANSWITNRGTLDYNFNMDMLNAWTPDNTNTNIPRLSFDDLNHNADPSTRFLYNASYLRFKTLQIGYTLPKDLLNNWGIDNIRIFLSGNNLWTITKYPGYDPSYTADGLLNRGLDQGLYPIARTISGGIYIHF